MKFKKIFVLPISCVALAACSSPTPTPVAEDKVDLFTAYSHENLLGDHNYLDEEEEGTKYKDRGKTLKFEGLRNENDAYQLMLHAKKDVNSYNLVINDDIKDSAGNKIDKSNFNVYAEWYQYVDVSIESVQLCPRGFYPDALIPIDKFMARGKNYIDKDRNQGIYVNLKIPKDQAAGEYNGSATLTVDEFTYDIPINVIVHPTVLEDDNHLNTCYLIWYNEISIGEREVTDDLEDAYYNTLLSKRIDPDQLPSKYYSTPEVFANTVATKIAPDPKISQYRFPVTGTNYTKQRVQNYMDALVDKQKKLIEGGSNLDLFKKLFFYVDDEPSGDKFQTVRDHDKEIYDIKKAAMEKFTDEGIRNSILHMKNIVTIPYTDELKAVENSETHVGGVQTWCPQFQHFHTEEQREVYYKRQQSEDRDCGENVWWYGCIDPKGKWPGYHLDSTTSYARIIPYMTYKYGIEGIIYWCVNFYQKHMNGSTSTRDVWNDPVTWENCCGDGCLMYPGSEYGCNAPLSTLRLENILAGNEEYEYLYMLNKKVEEYNEEKGESKDLNTLLKKQYDNMFSGVQVNRDKTTQQVDTKIVLDNAHILLKALDAFNESLDKGMEYLENLSK